LHKNYNQFATPYVDFLADSLPTGATIAVNGMMFSKASIDSIRKTLEARKINLLYRTDFISDIWQDRPFLSDMPVEIHDVALAGKSMKEKFADIRNGMQEHHTDYHLITALDDLAWTFNIRGKDVDYNPVVIAYAILGTENAHLFIQPSKVSTSIKNLMGKNNVVLHDYDSIVSFLNQLPENKKILVDPNICRLCTKPSIVKSCIRNLYQKGSKP
jgi:Xaa-Pro aminopeptidase